MHRNGSTGVVGQNMCTSICRGKYLQLHRQAPVLVLQHRLVDEMLHPASSQTNACNSRGQLEAEGMHNSHSMHTLAAARRGLVHKADIQVWMGTGAGAMDLG